jgi:hypothetical protein
MLTCVATLAPLVTDVDDCAALFERWIKAALDLLSQCFRAGKTLFADSTYCSVNVPMSPAVVLVVLLF